MTTDIAQDEAVESYRHAERALRKYARTQRQAAHPEEAQMALDLARHVGIEMVRNYRGRRHDEWEKPPTEVPDHDDQAREGWRP